MPRLLKALACSPSDVDWENGSMRDEGEWSHFLFFRFEAREIMTHLSLLGKHVL